MYKHLLVLIDGTPLATVTLDHAVAYAKSTGARQTFLHVRAEATASCNGAPLHAMSPEMFTEAAAGNARAAVAKAKAEASARAANVDGASMVETGDRPYEVILDAAIHASCDLALMGPRARRALKGAIRSSVIDKERAA
ncbi:universal stress protein [Variovorax sp. LjRoot175]|uniref:universal stress protein n=1 Tax=Variovorax sp. LjRoot175 TaxID=3342276 RepID=UPI003ED1469E